MLNPGNVTNNSWTGSILTHYGQNTDTLWTQFKTTELALNMIYNVLIESRNMLCSSVCSSNSWAMNTLMHHSAEQQVNDFDLSHVQFNDVSKTKKPLLVLHWEEGLKGVTLSGHLKPCQHPNTVAVAAERFELTKRQKKTSWDFIQGYVINVHRNFDYIDFCQGN